jgi:hypothetical protein
VRFLTAGTCSITANAGANATYGAATSTRTFAVTAAYLTNTITWDQTLSGRVGAADLALTATAATTVSYVSNTTAVCTIVAGKVRFLTVGKCSITASAGANATTAAAVNRPRNFTVLAARR